MMTIVVIANVQQLILYTPQLCSNFSYYVRATEGRLSPEITLKVYHLTVLKLALPCATAST